MREHCIKYDENFIIFFRVELIWSSFWRGVIPLEICSYGNSSRVLSNGGKANEADTKIHANGASNSDDHDDIVDEDVEDDMEIDEDVMDDDEEEDEEEPRSEVRRKMSHLVQIPQVKHFILEADYAFYQKLVNFLMPKVLKSIPNNLTQAIRNFAKSLEGWMVGAMLKAPEHLRVIKVTTVKSLSQALRRYTGLNHLAQAARAVLQNGSHISQMLSDLNRVDFANVQEQASWVCQCDPQLVKELEAEFKKTLEEQCGLEGWALWLESVVDRCMEPHRGRPDFPKAARKFLMRWSFYR